MRLRLRRRTGSVARGFRFIISDEPDEEKNVMLSPSPALMLRANKRYSLGREEGMVAYVTRWCRYPAGESVLRGSLRVVPNRGTHRRPPNPPYTLNILVCSALLDTPNRIRTGDLLRERQAS